MFKNITLFNCSNIKEENTVLKKEIQNLKSDFELFRKECQRNIDKTNKYYKGKLKNSRESIN